MLVGVGFSFVWAWGWHGTNAPDEYDKVFCVGPVQFCFVES